MRELDLVVIGGGSAGTAAALHARAQDLSVVLVESGERSTRQAAEAALADLLSVRPLSRAPRQRVGEGFQRAVRRAGEVAAAAADSRDRLLARTGVARLTGIARLTGERGGVEVASGSAREPLSARWVLVATGSSRLALPGGARDARASLLDAPEPPGSAIVVGGGREGVALAGLLACAGTRVTVLESGERLLGSADADVSSAVERALTAAGARIILGRRAMSAEPATTGARVLARTRAGIDETFEADVMFGCAASAPDLGALGLDEGVLRPPLPLHEYGTALDWLLVAGAASGRSLGPEAARREGRAAVARAVGRREHVPYEAIPVVIGGAGGCGWVGPSEADCARAGRSLLVGRARLAGRAAIPSGFVKLLADAGSERLLGVHLASPLGREATVLAGALVEMGASRKDLAAMAFPAGSAGDALAEAALAAAPP